MRRADEGSARSQSGSTAPSVKSGGRAAFRGVRGPPRLSAERGRGGQAAGVFRPGRPCSRNRIERAAAAQRPIVREAVSWVCGLRVGRRRSFGGYGAEALFVKIVILRRPAKDSAVYFPRDDSFSAGRTEPMGRWRCRRSGCGVVRAFAGRLRTRRAIRRKERIAA